MKKLLSIIWNEFVYGGHLLAVGLACIVILAAILLQIGITWDLVLIIYLISLAPCLFGRYFSIKEDALTNPERSQYLERKARAIPYFIGLLVFVLLTVIIYYHKYGMIVFCLGLISLSFIYDLFLKRFTRKIIGFKNFYVGILFSLLIVALIPYYNYQPRISFWLVISFIYIMSVMGAAFSDIKDIESDNKDGLRTFAVVFGASKIIPYIVVSIIIALLPIIFGVIYHLLPALSLGLILVLPYNLLLFDFARDGENKSDLLYSVAFDSQLILWLVFALIGKVIF